MIQSQKGKPPTRGAKKIVVENIATVIFYRNMALSSGLFHALLFLIFCRDSLTAFNIFMNVLAISLNVLSVQVMKNISKPKFTEATGTSTQMIEPGHDLNMEGGIGEHLKDVVIATSLTHGLSIFSNWLWLLLLFIPVRAFWLLWKNIIAPWIFQEPLEITEQDDKKAKKMIRTVTRYQGRSNFNFYRYYDR